MTAQLIDGNALSKQLRTQVAADTAALKAKGLTPGLAVVLVGDNPASQVYVRNKVKACEDAGLHSVLEKYEATMTEADLLARVEALNNDPAIHGILVQLPLPAHIDAQKVIEAISPAKDVDGFHIASAGALMTGMPGFWPCTPYGCMKMLESIGFDLKGKHAVVIGRSNIVGKPMALDAIFRIYSMTKPVVSVAIMMLYEQGKLLLTDPVARFISEFANQQVLESTSGEEHLRTASLTRCAPLRSTAVD